MKQHSPRISTSRRAMGAAAAVIIAGGAVFLAPGAADAKPKPKPKKGSVSATVPLTCTVLGNPFDYPAAIKLTGTRAPKSKSVALKATLSDLPGAAPVPLDYDTKTSLTVSFGGLKTILTGRGQVDVDPFEAVPIAPVKGSLTDSKNSWDVTVSEFSVTFGTPVFEVTKITCVPTDSDVLGPLKLK